jgi:hypothetical protein
MLSPYLYFPLALVSLAAVLFVAVRGSKRALRTPALTFPLHDVPLHRVPPYMRLWAAIVLLSAIEALALRVAQRSVGGPVYVGANFFLVCVLLLLVSSVPQCDPPGTPLLHLFAHVACALYLRVACWLLFTGSAS